MEGICLTLLTAHAGTVLLRAKGGKGKEECTYWKLVADQDERSEGNRAPHQVIANADRLSVSDESAQQLKREVENRHAHSHAGRLAMALRMDLAKGGKIYFGGHFDAEKLRGYQIELGQRAQLCKWALEVMKALLDGMTKLPEDISS